MAKKKLFMSHDYDNDAKLCVMLSGQAKLPDSPFDFTDRSLKEPLTGDWKAKIRPRIKNCDVVAVICGEKTHTAAGVSAEIQIAQEANVPYFLLKGYSDKACTRPTAAKSTDKMYEWTWDNLKKLVGGAR